MEPALACVAAVHSPSTGIIDSHALMLALQGDLENAGGLVAFNAAVEAIAFTRDGLVVRTPDGTELFARASSTRRAIYGAPRLRARPRACAPCTPSAYYAKGNYFTLSGRSPFAG